ncbi:mucin-5AC-like isoform X2 [Eriocheir sinensis]|uniref:mucin-5AC-like isoform X2 n=1 Tax=Eriocheir sinensis TaxID=95602 RepID=UPI0021C70A70|nr:mucin-5AC-like isoform X2 [Eriocheir sinensis]
MLLSTCTLLVVLVTTTQVEAASAAAESAMERPAEAKALETRGNPGGLPSVDAKRLNRRKRNLDFDGWFPMDVSNPMSDDPTLAYQPPPLERVHFSNDPVNEKPLYPVRPENPTVFVVRSELQEPEVHSVYGTENVEYYHINPQSNIVRAFRSPSFTIGETTLVPVQTDATTTATTQAYDEAVEESSRAPETNLDIPKKDEGFSDKSDNVYESTETSNTESPTKEKIPCEAESESDIMEGAFSEHRPTVIERPDLLYLLRDRRKKVTQTPRSPVQRRRNSLPRRRQDTLTVRQSSDSSSSRRPLHELLGNRPRESQIEQSPYLGSATDSAGASFREIPPPNFRYTSLRAASSRQSPVTTRVRGSSSRKPVSPTRPWYLIDTRSPDSSRRREPSIASYIIPETFSDDDKVHYKPQGPVSFVNDKQQKTLQDFLDNPHLDDYMNSYKPTLTANSLSELLQIFRYTQVTNGPGGAVTEEPVTLREFRYTRPTDETPTTEILPTNFRYTPSPSKFSDPTTEPGITEKPAAPYPDAVADTNSLDGYLFSDSVASPEYANPRVRQNAVVSESKNASKDKGAARGTSKVKINSNLVQRTSATPAILRNVQVINPGPAPSRKPFTTSPYVIYQGHSKVKVFGVNSAEEEDWSKVDIRDIFMASTPGTSSTTTTIAPPSSSTTTFPTATTSSVPTTPTSLTPPPSTEATTSPSTVSLSVEHSTNLPATDPTIPPDAPEATLPTTVSEEYEYYYDDGDYGVTDLAFGDYQTESLGQPLIYIPGQLPPPPSEGHFPHPPPLPLAGEGHNSDYPFDYSAVREPPHLQDSFPLALSPAVALTRAELSGERLVVLAEQQDDTTEDNQFPQPTEPVTETTYTNATTGAATEGDRGA